MNDEKILKIGLLFYICSIIGYFYELILNYFELGKIFNHGFLYGPWLPIYGIGAIMTGSLQKCKDNPIKIFLLALFLTGIFEGITGYLMLKILHIRLWDYTGYFLNINGFVSFLSAMCFGIGSLLVIYLLIPFVYVITRKYNKKILKRILEIITVAFLIDVVSTLVLRNQNS